MKITLKALNYHGQWFDMPPDETKMNEALADPRNPFKCMVLALTTDDDKPLWEVVLQRVDSILWAVEGQGREIGHSPLTAFDPRTRKHWLVLEWAHKEQRD